MKSKVYISCPKIVSTNDLMDIKYEGFVNKASSGKLQETISNISYWNKDSSYYNPSLLEECDKFVLVHPTFKFKFNINELPSGVLNEYKRAKALGKKIYLFYKTSGATISSNGKPQYNFYEITEKNSIIEGVKGTSHKIFEGEFDDYDAINVDDVLSESETLIDIVESQIDEIKDSSGSLVNETDSSIENNKVLFKDRKRRYL